MIHLHTSDHIHRGMCAWRRLEGTKVAVQGSAGAAQPLRCGIFAEVWKGIRPPGLGSLRNARAGSRRAVLCGVCLVRRVQLSRMWRVVAVAVLSCGCGGSRGGWVEEPVWGQDALVAAEESGEAWEGRESVLEASGATATVEERSRVEAGAVEVDAGQIDATAEVSETSAAGELRCSVCWPLSGSGCFVVEDGGRRTAGDCPQGSECGLWRGVGSPPVIGRCE